MTRSIALAYLEQDCAVAAVGRLISWKCCYAYSAKTICSLLRHLPLQQWRASFGGNDAVAAVWNTFAGALLWHVGRRTAWRVWWAGHQFTAVPQADPDTAAPAVACARREVITNRR